MQCEEKTCKEADGYYENCPAPFTGINLQSTPSTTAYYGDVACNTCTYTCNQSLNYFSTCPTNYICDPNSSITQINITCQKPTGCSGEYVSEEDKDPSKIYQEITQYGVICYKETGNRCDRNIYTFDQTCTTYIGMHEVGNCVENHPSGSITYYDCEPDVCEGSEESCDGTITKEVSRCNTNNATGTNPVTKYTCEC
ncbi:MAG: hypothetical protein IKW39_01630, partial [Alphaproteobacteria bacterium]|nr:hypothetical protein [Alphaproteobacteria bacterium]